MIKVRAFLLIVLLGSTTLLLYGQLNKLTKAQCVYRVEADENWHFSDAKPFLPYGDTVRQPNTMVTVRVCSKEPLMKAWYLSGRKPSDVLAYMMMTYGYSSDRILFLRSSECQNNASHTAAVTEVWLVPPDTAPPPSNESLKLCQVKEIELGKTIESTRKFNKILSLLTTSLNQKSQALGVVVGIYNKHGKQSIKRRLDKVRRTLDHSQVPADQYLIRLLKTNDSGPSTSSRNSYLNIFLYEKTEDCHQP